MKKNFVKFAVLAASVLSMASFASCDDDENFESKKFTVTLPVKMGTGYAWQWTNSAAAAADSVSKVTTQTDSEIVGGPGIETWTFQTKEKGEEQLKFRYLREWDQSTVLKDTVITFKK